MKFKKAILGLLSLSIVTATGLTAFANNNDIIKLDDEVVNVLPISEPISDEINKVSFSSFTGVVTEINESINIEGMNYVLVESKDSGIANIVVSENTYVLNNTEIKIGDTITGYYDANAPMLMIYPPQYNARVVAVNPEENVKVDIFNEDLVGSDNTLKLNIGDDTEIISEDGTKFDGDLTNRKLVVTYGVSTRSIPAQTTPTQIVVLSENEEMEDTDVTEDTEVTDDNEVKDDNGIADLGDVSTMDIVVENNKIDAPSAYTNEDGVVMVPVRAIAEALGSTVKWNDDIQSVIVDTGITFKLGEDQYNYMRMMPIKLEAKSELVEGTTYVPLSFFREVMKVNNAYVFEGQIVVDNGEKME